MTRSTRGKRALSHESALSPQVQWAPSFLLVSILALAAKLTATTLTTVSPVFCAVVLGLVWRNCVGLSPRAELGVQWISHRVLRVGIALVGLRLTLAGLSDVAELALPIVAGCILVALTVSAIVGRLLRIQSPLQVLLAFGTAVCGCTAVVLATPVVRAKPEETGLAVTAVVLFGSLGMLTYPWLAHALFDTDNLAAGLFLGTAIHDTSQVIGASLIYAQQFGTTETPAVAAATKLLRNLSLIVLIPLAGYWARKHLWRANDTTAADAPTPQLTDVFPVFLIVFLFLIAVRTAGDSAFQDAAQNAAWWWQGALDSAAGVSELCLICGMTAIGLNVSVAHLRGLHWRAPALACAVAAAVAIASISLLLLLR